MIDGAIDSSFGTNAKSIINFNEGESYINSIALKTDGRIVAAGVVGSVNPFFCNCTIAS